MLANFTMLLDNDESIYSHATEPACLQCSDRHKPHFAQKVTVEICCPHLKGSLAVYRADTRIPTVQMRKQKRAKPQLNNSWA
jgi:hypothetical protein